MYRGRFAPSPTGPLHFGSLIAAVASYLEAKVHQGQWLLRIEDLDLPRQVPGAADLILHTMQAYGFEWDGEVVYQSKRDALYAEALYQLEQAGLIYPCGCSRKEIADSAIHGVDGLVYPGTCRHGLAPGKQSRAWRVRVNTEPTSLVDNIQGPIQQSLTHDIGDFVLKRADGLFAYQLAVVVDDQNQDISHIVRGADLLDSTPRQIFLQQALGFTQPGYAHVPVATNLQGEKLSKQTLATPLNPQHKNEELWQVLDFLGQTPPAELRNAGHGPLWQWAHLHWRMSNIARQRTIAIV
ncbi:tRNA glutamyl-Q(34) synthetase GluQRS [Methylobacillus gramineus]|uniref:tRNA glutamyl-Q(34) synthetase GluQRS n=1 Tax=Methylobacillus gramineus TaxID=755169 RepID=UPI001CFFD72C|nr:tRNA glutamyl-Q(34) synthetase GluQRS [Methylobacillus gramineus]MCB5183944.1 tRNA glutamyl-Q(34) synthetase GluQRS [Methylobacillus gramineus]